MRQKKILVTGAAGMLGRALLDGWSGRNSVVGTARLSGGEFLPCDLSQKNQVKGLFSKRTFDLAVHTAAYSNVDGCERDPERAYESNAVASKNLAQACGQKNIPLIYISTDYVFNGLKNSPYKETDRTCPVNIYGMTKLEGEYHVQKHARVSAVVRTSWLFGPGNPLNFVNHILARLAKEPAVAVLDDQKDSPTYVKDLTKALENVGAMLTDLAQRKTKKNFSEIYHVCNSGVATRYDMALKIKGSLRLKNTRIKLADPKSISGRLAVRPAYAAMSTSRYQKSFKSSLRGWEEALEEYVQGVVS